MAVRNEHPRHVVAEPVEQLAGDERLTGARFAVEQGDRFVVDDGLAESGAMRLRDALAG